MGKPQGLWAAMYPSLFDDPRTIEAAEVLIAGRVPRYVARQVIVTALLRLHVHALSEGDTGATGHLSDRRLLDIAWPEAADAPRNLGRMKLAATLRRALWAVPYGHETGYLCCDKNAQQSARSGHTEIPNPSPHERLAEFAVWHSKILGDRRRRRERAENAVAARTPDRRAGAPARTPGGAIPNPTHRTVGNPPLPPQGGAPPSRAGSSAGASGAAAASRAPGVGGGLGLGLDLAGVRELLMVAAPNIQGQQRNGRDTTLRPGAHYLLRIGAFDVALREQLIGDMGRDPTPGALLAAAAPESFTRLATKLVDKLPEARNKGAYVRSALARTWQDALGRLADESTLRRARGESTGG